MTTTLLADLRAAGFTVTAAGDRLAVSPASKLSTELRAAIRAQKAALLAALRASAAPVDPRRLTAPAETQARLLRLAERTGWPAIRHWTGVEIGGEDRWRAWAPKMNDLSVGFFIGALERRLHGCPDGVGLDEWLKGEQDGTGEETT